jgi:esterase/lipase superfamily enzyme
VFYGTNRQPDPRNEAIAGEPRKEKEVIGRDAGMMYGAEVDQSCEHDPEKFRKSGEREDVCHLGKITVALPVAPEDRKSPGKFPAGAYVDGNSASEHFWAVEHEAFCGNTNCLEDFDQIKEIFKNAVAESLIEDLDGENNSKGHAFVFIHGFNVKFRNAAFRAAQLKTDMNFDGPVFFYSWPSNGKTSDYFSDQIDADVSVDGLVRFLNLLKHSLPCAEQPGDASCKNTQLHIIAHSMGARVASQALARIAVDQPDLQFGEVIFAAGDIDHTLFRKWVGAALPNVAGVTVYTSSFDGAVGVSTFFRDVKLPWRESSGEKRDRVGYIRKNKVPFVFQAGAVGDLVDIERVHTVDISNVASAKIFYGTNWKKWFIDNHSVYATRLSVVDDILDVMCSGSGRNPEERGIATPVQIDNQLAELVERTYWKMKMEEGIGRLIKRNGCS